MQVGCFVLHGNGYHVGRFVPLDEFLCKWDVLSYTVTVTTWPILGYLMNFYAIGD